MIATHQLDILVKMRDEATRKMERLSREVKSLTFDMKTLGWAGGIVAGTLAALGTIVAIKGLEAFKESEVEMMRFETRLKALPPALQAYRDEILKVANKAIYLGFSSETAAKNIVHLLGITGDMETALILWGLSMDLVRYKGMDLDTAVRAVGMAWMGNTRLLKEFGIEIDEHADKTTVITALTKTVKGAAEDYSKTLQGQSEVLREVVDESKSWIGELIVKNLRIKETIDNVVRWIEAQGGIQKILEDNKGLIMVISGLLFAVFIGAIVAVIAAIWSFIAAFVVLGVKIALVTGFITSFVTALWIAKDEIWEAMKKIRDAFVGYWGKIKDYIKEVIDWFSKKWDDLVEKLNWVWEKLEGIGRKIKEIVGRAGGIAGGIVERIGGVVGLQKGGIVTRPILARIGERGPEAVIPLDRMRTGTVNIYLSGTFLTEKEVAERWANQIVRVIKYQLRV